MRVSTKVVWRLAHRIARGAAGAPSLRAAISHTKPTALLQQRLGARVVRTDEASRFAGSFDGRKIAFDGDAVVRVRKDAGVGDVAKGMAPNLTALR